MPEPLTGMEIVLLLDAARTGAETWRAIGGVKAQESHRVDALIERMTPTVEET